MIETLRRLKKSWACRVASWRCQFRPEDNIILFTDPRGGSTWLTEALQCIPRTAVLWEPLQIMRVKEFRDLGFAWRQYIPEDAEWEECRATFEKLLSGKILNRWLCGLSSPADFLAADRMIVKFCRANALIPWLVRNFKFTLKPIHLVRHPFAVVASQLSHGSWDYRFEGFQIPGPPFNEFYLEHAEFLRSLKTKEEALVATWCLTNRIPLNHPRKDQLWMTVHYEDLILRPEDEIGRIFKQWELPVPEALLQQLDRPSARTKDDTFVRSSELQLAKWQEKFSAQQISSFQTILDYFGVEIYNAGTLPCKDWAQPSDPTLGPMQASVPKEQ